MRDLGGMFLLETFGVRAEKERAGAPRRPRHFQKRTLLSP